jgi:hypothetical protein
MLFELVEAQTTEPSFLLVANLWGLWLGGAESRWRGAKDA